MKQNPALAGLGLAGRLAHTFLNSKLTPLFIAASLALGIFSVVSSREEERRFWSDAGHYNRDARRVARRSGRARGLCP